MLNFEQYEKLLSLYDWDKTIVQTNHYFDTNDLQLSEMHITCRVREINGSFFLQMKYPSSKTYSRIELEKPLSKLADIVTADDLPKPEGSSALPDVKRLGTLTTTRSVKCFGGAEIDLDKSEYFGKTDYELEIEFTDESTARALLSEITEKLNIQANSELCTGKIRRFLAEYSKTKAPS